MRTKRAPHGGPNAPHGRPWPARGTARNQAPTAPLRRPFHLRAEASASLAPARLCLGLCWFAAIAAYRHRGSSRTDSWLDRRMLVRHICTAFHSAPTASGGTAVSPGTYPTMQRPAPGDGGLDNAGRPKRPQSVPSKVEVVFIISCTTKDPDLLTDPSIRRARPCFYPVDLSSDHILLY